MDRPQGATDPAFPGATGGAGMTLRDYFAAQAMIAFADNPSMRQSLQTGGANAAGAMTIAAGHAFAMADAMLRARSS